MGFEPTTSTIDHCYLVIEQQSLTGDGWGYWKSRVDHLVPFHCHEKNCYFLMTIGPTERSCLQSLSLLRLLEAIQLSNRTVPFLDFSHLNDPIHFVTTGVDHFQEKLYKNLSSVKPQIFCNVFLSWTTVQPSKLPEIPRVYTVYIIALN